MSVLNLLIKKNKSEIQILLKDLNILQSQFDEIEQEKQKLHEDIHQQSHTHRDYDYLRFVDSFIRASKNRIANINKEQESLELKMISLSKDIFELFSETKKYEEVTAQQKKKEHLNREQKQQAILDEYVLYRLQKK